jgi:hypothetical protein
MKIVSWRVNNDQLAVDMVQVARPVDPAVFSLLVFLICNDYQRAGY